MDTGREPQSEPIPAQPDPQTNLPVRVGAESAIALADTSYASEDESLEDMLEFAENPEPRCPCVLLLDTSYSMNAEDAIGALNAGIQTFKSELQNDPLVSLRVEVAVVTFGKGVEVAQDFVTVDNFMPRKLKADGASTPMGGGVHLALDIIEGRKRQYRDSGIGYYRPWVFMITDGVPTGEPPEVTRSALERIINEEGDKRVAFFSVGVAGADLDQLKVLPRAPLSLRGLAFSEMFVWLSSSISQVSKSRTDDDIRLDTDGLRGWASI